LNRLRLVLSAGLLAAVVGCGSGDPNKNLKPIDPNTPPPKPAVEGAGGGGDKPAPVAK
jgi:hypothetical protein